MDIKEDREFYLQGMVDGTWDKVVQLVNSLFGKKGGTKMNEIIDLAENLCNHWKPMSGCNISDLKALSEAIEKRRALEQSPITEKWLKEHGFKNEYHGTWCKILHHWKDCDNFSHTIGLSVSSQNICNTMEGELSLIVNADSKGYLSKSIYSLADLYDAMELCGIEMED